MPPIRTRMHPDARIIERIWPVTLTGGPRKIPRHDAYHFQTKDHRYVLKLCGSWASREDAERSSFVYFFLHKKKFHHSPRIIAARNGALFSRFGERFAYLTERVAGREPAPTAANYESFGLIAARLHSIKDFPRACPICPRSLAPGMLAFAKSVDFGREYAGMVRALPSFDSFPAGLIHADLSLGNSVIGPDSRIVILDWDESGTGPRILDAAYPLIMIFLTEELRFRKDLAAAFYNAYCRRIKLCRKERDRLFEAALFYALWFVRFGNPSKRWRRIKHALGRRNELMSVLPRS